jgi:hypothetical protein
MLTRIRSRGSALVLLLLSAFGVSRCNAPPPLDEAAFDALYQTPLPPPPVPMKVFHLGHSLVGRDMPAMLQQLSGEGHEYDSQLGWGTTLKAHWGDAPISGFERENAHSNYRDAGDAADSGEYDAFIVTEMVEIRDAIKYFDSWDYLNKWARRAWDGKDSTRVYLYETWHPIDTPEGWLQRLSLDLSRYWENEILRRALAAGETDRTIYVIPAGQVMEKFVRELENRGGVDGLKGKEDLFARNEKGELDTIHINDIGAYLVALTHYAVLYQRSPVGLPHQLRRADGSLATAPGPKAARLMQDVVWQVVSNYPKTGVPQDAHKESSQ